MAHQPKGDAMEQTLVADELLNDNRHWKVLNGQNEVAHLYPTHQEAMQKRPPLHWLQAESDTEVRARLAQNA